MNPFAFNVRHRGLKGWWIIVYQQDARSKVGRHRPNLPWNLSAVSATNLLRECSAKISSRVASGGKVFVFTFADRGEAVFSVLSAASDQALANFSFCAPAAGNRSLWAGPVIQPTRMGCRVMATTGCQDGRLHVCTHTTRVGSGARLSFRPCASMLSEGGVQLIARPSTMAGHERIRGSASLPCESWPHLVRRDT
jgi:hypothetical protein